MVASSEISFVACNRIYLANKFLSTLAHEYVHICQIDKDGMLKFYWNYVFNKRRRLQYELEAYTINMFVEWLTFGSVSSWRAKDLAQIISGKTYCKMISFEAALHIVNSIVESIPSDLPNLVCFEDVEKLF
jgi:hypothetical protein